MSFRPDVLRYTPEFDQSERRFNLLAYLMAQTLLHTAGHLEVDDRQQLLPLFRVLADPHKLLRSLNTKFPFQISYTGDEKYYSQQLGILDLIAMLELSCPKDFREQVLTSRANQQKFIRRELRRFIQVHGENATDQWVRLIQRGILDEYLNTVTAAHAMHDKAEGIRVHAFPESIQRHVSRIDGLSPRALELQALGRLAITDYPYDPEIVQQNEQVGQEVATILEPVIMDLFKRDLVPLLVNIAIYITNAGTIGSFGSPWSSALNYSAGENGGLYNITEKNIFYDPAFRGGDWATLIINRAVPNTVDGKFVARPLDEIVAIAAEEYIQTSLHPYFMVAFGKFAFLLEELCADLLLQTIPTAEIPQIASSKHASLADCVPEAQKTKPEGAELAAIIFQEVFQQAMQDGYFLHFLFDPQFAQWVQALSETTNNIEKVLAEFGLADLGFDTLANQTISELLRSLGPDGLKNELSLLYRNRRAEYTALEKQANLYDPYYLQRFNLLNFVEKPF